MEENREIGGKMTQNLIAEKVDRKALTLQTIKTIDDWAGYLGVQKELLDGFVKAFGYDKKDITQEEMKGLLIKSGVVEASTSFFRNKLGETGKILESFNKETDNRAMELSTKLEGNIILATAAKNANLEDGEIQKFLAKKANVANSTEYFDGKKMQEVNLTYAQHIGIMYMGMNKLDEKFSGGGVEELTNDYLEKLTAMFVGAKTADDLAAKIKGSVKFDALNTALALECTSVMGGKNYGDNSIAMTSNLIERGFNNILSKDEQPCSIISTAKEIDPKFGKEIENKLNEQEERDKFRRYLAIVFGVGGFCEMGLDRDNIEKLSERATYAYLLGAAINYSVKNKTDREYANEILGIHSALGDKLALIGTKAPEQQTELEKEFIKALIIKKPEEREKIINGLRDKVIIQYATQMGLDSKSDTTLNIAWFFNPEIIQKTQNKEKLNAALSSAQNYFGLRGEDIQEIINGRGAQIDTKEMEKTRFYTTLKKNGFTQEEITQILQNFLGSAAHIYLVKGEEGSKLLDEIIAQVPLRKTIDDDLRAKLKATGSKEAVKAVNVINDTLERMWDYANKNLTTTKNIYSFSEGANFDSQVAKMFGLDSFRDLAKPLNEKEFADITEKLKKNAFYTGLLNNGKSPEEAIRILINLVSPVAVCLKNGGKEDNITKILNDCINSEKDKISVEAFVNALQSNIKISQPPTKEIKTEYKPITIKTNKGAWTLEVDDIYPGLLTGDAAIDANVKHKVYELSTRLNWHKEKSSLNDKELKTALQKKDVSKISEIVQILAENHAGSDKPEYKKMIGRYLAKMEDEFKDWTAIEEFVKANDSVYNVFKETAEKMINTYFESLKPEDKNKLKKQFFLCDVAIMRAEQGVTVDGINKIIKHGETQTFTAENISGMMNFGKGVYTVYHLKEDGTKETIASVVDKTVKMENKEIKWKIGDYYYISHNEKGKEVLDAHISSFYYSRRIKFGKQLFWRNGSKNAELTLLNLNAMHNPFDINGKKEIKTEVEKSVPPVALKLGITPAISFKKDVITEKEDITKKTLQYIGVPSAMSPFVVPVVSPITNIIAPKTEFNIDADSIANAVPTQGYIDALLGQFGYNNNSSDMAVTRQNIVDFTIKQVSNSGAAKNVVIKGSGSIYVYNGQITEVAPTDGFYLRYDVSGDKFKLYDTTGGCIGDGTISSTGELTLTETRAPLYLTINNLAQGKLPYGIGWSLGAKTEFSFRYGEHWPEKYAGQTDIYPFLTLARPFAVRGGVVNPYLTGMYASGGVQPFAGISWSKSREGEVMGLSFTAGAGWDLAQTSKALPSAGVGFSLYGAQIGIGTNLKSGNMAYVETGYDRNHDGIMDYGVRLMPTGPLWIPDIVIDGQGIIGKTLGYIWKGLKGTYRKTKGEEQI